MDGLTPVCVGGRDVGWVLRVAGGFSFVLIDERDTDTRVFASLDAARTEAVRCQQQLERALQMLDT